MKKVMEVLNHNQEILASTTTWVRGIELTFYATADEILIYAGDIFMAKQVFAYDKVSDLHNFAKSFKIQIAKGQQVFNIPQARSNEVDEFVYVNEAGQWSVLSGYSMCEWTEADLTTKERESGRFFLKRTNVILGTLVADQTYTLMDFSTPNKPEVRVNQSMSDVRGYSRESNWLRNYLNGQIMIFEESKAIQLEENQWNPLWVAALNENSGYKQLSWPLTPELEKTYFTDQELKSQLGYDVIVSKVVPSGYTIHKTDKEPAKVTYYYHSDIIPQFFLCKCGKNKRQAGPLTERICWDCVGAYQESCIQRSANKFEDEVRFETKSSNKPLAFVELHTNDSASKIGCEIINLCVVDEEQNILFESLVQPKAPLSRNARKKGYDEQLFEVAPSFEEIHDDFVKTIQDKTVVLFNGKKRRELYKAICLEKGIDPVDLSQAVSLKDILIPISRGAKRIQRLKAVHQGLELSKPQRLELEGEFVGVQAPESYYVQKEVKLMSKICQQLKAKQVG